MNKALEQAFPVESRPLFWRKIWVYFKMAFPSPCHSCEGIFFSWFVTLRILGVSAKVCPSPFPSGLQPQEFLTATRPCSFQHSSEWPCKCSSRYMVSEVSAPSKQTFLSFSAFAHLQSLGWQVFVPQPQFLTGPRKVVDFAVSLTLTRMRVMTSKLFTCQSWNWKSDYGLAHLQNTFTTVPRLILEQLGTVI